MHRDLLLKRFSLERVSRFPSDPYTDTTIEPTPPSGFACFVPSLDWLTISPSFRSFPQKALKKYSYSSSSLSPSQYANYDYSLFATRLAAAILSDPSHRISSMHSLLQLLREVPFHPLFHAVDRSLLASHRRIAPPHAGQRRFALPIAAFPPRLLRSLPLRCPFSPQ